MSTRAATYAEPPRSRAPWDPRSTAGEQRVSINPQQQQAILDKANRTVSSVLESMVGDGPSKEYWRPKGRKKGISYFVDDAVADNQYRFCCVSETRASVEDVLNLFLVTDTATLLTHCRIMYDCLLDAEILNVIAYPTKSNPFKSVYVRYTSFESPKLLDNRDMCLAVATNKFTHLDGSTIGYCLWDSVDLPECPSVPGLVRMRMFRSGFFVQSSGNPNDTTKIVYFVGTEAGGIAPRLATKLALDKFTSILGRICGHFRRKNLDPTTFVHRTEWASKSQALLCQSCSKKFNALSSRINCAACGSVVCKSCVTREKVDVPGAGLTTVHVCTSCLEMRGVDVATERSDSPKTVVSLAKLRSTSSSDSDEFSFSGSFLGGSSSR